MISCIGRALPWRIRDRRASVRSLIVALAVAAGLLAPDTVHAATLTWWATGSTGSAGGTGTWDTTSARWTSDGSTWSPWSNTNVDTAIFAGTAGTVTLTTGITVGGLTLDTTGYTITGNTLTLAGGTANVTLSSGVATIASTVSGTALFTKLGSGTLTLSSSNNYSAGTLVSAGRIVLGNNCALGSGTVTLDGGEIQRDAAGVTVANAIAINAGGGTIVGRTSAVDDYVTLSGQLTGSGSLSILGLVNLAGSGGTYSGPITLTGTNTTFLRFSSSSAIAAATSITTTTAGKIRLDGVTVEVASLTSNGEVFNSKAATVGRLRVGSGTMSGRVYEGSGQLAIEKVNSGTLTISGSNSYSGGTTVSAGRIVLGNDFALGTGTVTLDGGTIERNIAGATVANAITVNASGGTIVGRTTVDNYTTLSGQLTGSGPLTTQGLVLLNNTSNTYSGTLTISNASASYLTLAASEVLGDTAVVSLGGANAKFGLNGGVTETIGGLAGAAGNVFARTSGTARLKVASSGTYGGTFSDSGNSLVLEKSGSGVLVLNSSNGNGTAIAGVEVTGGTLRLLGGSLAFNTGYFTGSQPITVRSGGTLEVAGGYNTAATNLITVDGGTLSVTAGSAADSSNYVNNLTLMNGATVTGNALRSGYTSNVTISSTGSVTNTFSAGLVLVSASYTTTFAVGSGTLAMSGAVADLSGFAGMPVIKSGAGTLTLSGSNSYTGGTQLSAGVLNFGNLSAFGTGTVSFTGNSTLQSGTAGSLTNAISLGSGVTGTFDSQSNSNTFSGVISGAGGLTKIGAGTLTLSGSNTYAGGAQLSAGVLNFGNLSAFGTGTVSLTGNSTLQSGTAGSLTNAISLGSGVTGTFDSQSNSNTFSGVISGAGGLTKIGAGTLTLSGSNSYSGPTNVNAGTLLFSSTAALYGGATASWTAANLTTGSGATAAFAVSGASGFTSGNLDTLFALGTGSTGFLAGSLFGIDTTGTTFTYASNIANPNGGANALGLVKLGSGTLTLSGSSTYSGNTVVNAGTLVAGTGVAASGGNSPAFGTGNITVNNASITGTTTFAVGGGNSTTRALTLNSGTWNIDYAGPGGEYIRSLTLASGLVTTSNTSWFRAPNGGLSISTLASSGTSVIGSRFDLTYSNLTLDVADGTATIDLAINGAITENSGGAGSGAKSVTKSGAGTVLLAASNSYSGGTVINAGTVVSGTGVAASSGNSPAFGTGDITVNNASITGTTARSVGGGSNTTRALTLNSGTWNIDYAGPGGEYIRSLTLTSGLVTTSNTSWFRAPNGGLSISTIASSGTSVIAPRLDLTYSNLTLDVADGAATIDLAINGAITEITGAGSGAKSITKSGAGTVLLAASNSYSGGTQLSAGVLNFGNLSAFGTGTVSFTGNSTLQSGTAGSLTNAISVGSGVTGTFDSQSNSNTFSGVISGAGGLTKIGSGTLTLSGSNTYAGNTTISAGVLLISNTAGLQGTSGVTIAGGAGLSYTGAGAMFAKNVTITAGSGTGTITNSGGGLLTLSGTLSKDNSVLRLTGGSFNVAGLITGTTVGASDLVVDAAAVTLSNTNTYNGPTYVYNSGTLLLGIDNAIPNTSVVSLGNSTTRGTLVTGTFSDSISQLVFSGSGGTLSLSGDKTGAVQLATAGSLTLGSNASLVLTSPGTSAGLYRLISATSISGTFAGANVTGVPTNYSLLYSGTEIDLQYWAGQASTFTLATGTVTRALVNTTVALSGSVTNTSPAGSANLGVSLASGGVLSVTGLSSGTSSLAPQASTSVAGTIQAGGVAGSRSWSVINIDNNAIQTTSTASGSLTVVNQRTFTTSTSTLALGVVHLGASFGSPTLVVTSTGLNDVTANATLGSFAGGPGGLSLNLTSGSAAFLGATSPQSATYTLAGTAGTPGTVSGTFASSVSAEFGSIPDVTVAVSGQVFSGTATWNVAGGGAWGTGASANWTSTGGVGAAPGTFAGYANTDVAIFAGSQGGTSTILLDGATPSLASLVFTNTTGSYVIGPGSGGSLSLAATPGMPTVDVAANALADIKTAILGSSGLQKLGAGTLLLSGSSNYSGGTDVSAGTLAVNGSVGGAVSVASAAVLAGTGTIGGLVSVLGGGILAPGNGGPGTFIAGGGLSLADAAILNFQLSAANTTAGGGINDLVTVIGDFTLDGILNVAAIGGGDFTGVANGTHWRLFNYSGTLTNKGPTFGSMPTLGGDRYYAVDTSTAGVVDLIVVPEPGSLVLAGIGIAGAAWAAAKRRRRAS